MYQTLNEVMATAASSAIQKVKESGSPILASEQHLNGCIKHKVQVDASNNSDSELILDVKRSILDTFFSAQLRAKVPVEDIQVRFMAAPYVMTPMGAQAARLLRESFVSPPIDMDIATKAIDMCISTTLAPNLMLRRHSATGLGLEDTAAGDMCRNNREKYILTLGLRTCEKYEHRFATIVAARVEPKGKVKVVPDYKGNKYCWCPVIPSPSGFMWAQRIRPFYCHPPTNMAISAFCQLLDQTKRSRTTCPRLGVPSPDVLNEMLRQNSSVAIGDVSRMCTCVLDSFNEMISKKLAKQWSLLTSVEPDYFYWFLKQAWLVRRILYVPDHSRIVSTRAYYGIQYPYNGVISHENISIGNADGVGGTTMRNNMLMTYWIMLLFRRLGLPIPKSLDEISSGDIRFCFVGDTVLCISDSIPALEVMTALKDVIRNNSVNGDFKFSDSQTETWCGYRYNHVTKRFVIDELTSIAKILSPEIGADDYRRPNPLAGFMDAKAKFSSINQADSWLTDDERKSVLKNFNRIDLAFDESDIDHDTEAPDLEVYFYHPNWVGKKPPETYFLSVPSQTFVNAIKANWDKEIDK